MVSPASQADVSVSIGWDGGFELGGNGILSEAIVIRGNFSIEPGTNARGVPESDVCIGGAGDGAPSEGIVISVNLSMELGVNPRDSAEMDVGA